MRGKLRDKPASVEYMCTYCGAKNARGLTAGRPQPGKCPRRKGDMPHRWVVNKKF